MPIVKFLPLGKEIKVQKGSTVLMAERAAGIRQDAPCGGHGKCGKCKVWIKGKEALACRTQVWEDVIVTVNGELQEGEILSQGIDSQFVLHPVKEGSCHIGVDIGTTTVVAYLLDGTKGEILDTESMLNPQFPYGADVISRIQAAAGGKLLELSRLIREGVWHLIQELCRKRRISLQDIGTVAVVANPAMQQLFFQEPVENLAKPPFSPVFTKARILPLSDYFPVKEEGRLLLVPDIAGYVGADTMGCILASGMYLNPEITLMIDIGTNGEMVLGNSEQMVACSTAAGPALEGGRISCGMRGCPGAIDHVWTDENGKVSFSVIGDEEEKGICGSGLIDAVAVMLGLGILNKRGRIQKDYQGEGKDRFYRLTKRISLTQEDIREVQMAKGAIAAGITLMMKERKVKMEDIHKVILCGAFGNYMDPKSACTIGLLPRELLGKIKAGGNAAGMGSRIMALDQEKFFLTQELLKKIKPIELASFPEFQRIYAENMMFLDK